MKRSCSSDKLKNDFSRSAFRIAALSLFVFNFSFCMAQDPLVDLPWFPHRDTNNIRTILMYAIDTATGERRLVYTERYDRNGFLYDTADRMVYDRRGRLTEYISYKWVSTSADPMPKAEPDWHFYATYAADGSVQHIRNVYYAWQDSMVYTYSLIHRKVHPQYGLLDYTFRRTYKHSQVDREEVDTVYLRREYDDHGHLLHEESVYGELDAGFSDIRYTYDAFGRRLTEVDEYYEYSDSSYYHYDEHGVLTHKTGKAYDIEIEGDFTILCRPDGTSREKWFYWDQENEAGAKSVYYTRFDERGNVVYTKSSDSQIVNEFEIEYWE